MRIATLRRERALPLADLTGLHGAAQRTSLVRVFLAAALAGTFALLFVTARSAGAGRAAVFPEGVHTGVVALDMSASISGPTYSRVATTLRGIVNANQSIGLVMFSDTAYELLPPNSPPGALAQFIPFFVPDRYATYLTACADHTAEITREPGVTAAKVTTMDRAPDGEWRIAGIELQLYRAARRLPPCATRCTRNCCWEATLPASRKLGPERT